MDKKCRNGCILGLGFLDGEGGPPTAKRGIFHLRLLGKTLLIFPQEHLSYNQVPAIRRSLIVYSTLCVGAKWLNE
jgi:hypothetical protein